MENEKNINNWCGEYVEDTGISEVYEEPYITLAMSSFVAGAERMYKYFESSNLKHSETLADIEIIKRANEYACRINPKSKREHKQLVGAYIVGADDIRKQYKSEIDTLRNKIFELNNALEESRVPL